MSLSTLKCRQHKIPDRVSSTSKDEDESKISLTSPGLLVDNNEQSKMSHLFCNRKIVKSPTKLVKTLSLRTEKLWLPSRNDKVLEIGDGPKRPGLLRAEPIVLLRPTASVIPQEEKEARFKANLRERAFVFSPSSSQSSEYYDDRSPVLGGWSSDSPGENSCSKLCLRKLGSSESDRDYGGEEG